MDGFVNLVPQLLDVFHTLVYFRRSQPFRVGLAHDSNPPSLVRHSSRIPPVGEGEALTKCKHTDRARQSMSGETRFLEAPKLIIYFKLFMELIRPQYTGSPSLRSRRSARGPWASQVNIERETDAGPYQGKDAAGGRKCSEASKKVAVIQVVVWCERG